VSPVVDSNVARSWASSTLYSNEKTEMSHNIRPRVKCCLRDELCVVRELVLQRAAKALPQSNVSHQHETRQQPRACLFDQPDV
jgi:hypothetical protein